MSDLKRYSIDGDGYTYFDYVGAYIRYADVAPLLAAHERLREKVARLCGLNKRVGDRCRLDHGWSAQDVTDHREELSERDALFAELDAQGDGK